MVITTINRTEAAKFLAVYAAENLLNMAPKGDRRSMPLRLTHAA